MKSAWRYRDEPDEQWRSTSATRAPWLGCTTMTCCTAWAALYVSGEIATCGMIDLELLYSARTGADHERS